MTNLDVKILHVVNISFVLPYYIGDQFNYFNKKGINFYVACSSSSHLFEYAEEKDFIAIPVNILREIKPIQDLKTIFQLVRIIRKNGIQIVIGHTPKGAMIAMLAAFLAGVSRRIYFRHGLMYETSKGLKRLMLKSIERLTGALATKIVCVSDSVRNKSISENLNHRKKNLILNLGTCNGINVERFTRKKIDDNELNLLKDRYGIMPNDFVVGFVGRLVNDKGIGELLLGWEIVSKKFTNVKLLLIGPLEERDAISKDLKALIKNESSVIHTGLIHDVLPYYGMMDTFILPSYREGFPTVVLEASAMELPVITTRSTGCMDSIMENETGVFCDIDPLSIAKKISYYITNKSIAVNHGINGREFVLSNFKQEIIWKEIEDKVLELK